MIVFENVSMNYRRSATPALDDVSFQIQDGEFVFLVGQSGAGKSSILRLLMREVTPKTGTVIVDEINVGRLRKRKIPILRRKFGMVFQDFRLLPEKSVAENVAFAMQILGKTRKEIKQTVPQVLDLVGLLDKSNRRPNQLSGGEQQRVAIARALAGNPKIIFADEPTANLDTISGNAIIDLLGELNKKGQTIIMVTHEEEYTKYCNRIVRMEDGKIIEEEVLR